MTYLLLQIIMEVLEEVITQHFVKINLRIVGLFLMIKK